MSTCRRRQAGQDNVLATVAAGGSFPHGAEPTPLLVYDDAYGAGFPPRYDCAWSNFYERYERTPELTHLLPPYVARRFEAVPGVGKVGLADGVEPAWTHGPRSAVDIERRERERDGR